MHKEADESTKKKKEDDDRNRKHEEVDDSSDEFTCHLCFKMFCNKKNVKRHVETSDAHYLIVYPILSYITLLF